MNSRDARYHRVDAFEKIPFLVHGFGTKYWREEDFESDQGLAGFHRVSLRQTHSDIIRIITELPPRRLEGDALMTNLPGFLLLIKTADCLPAFIVDAQNRAVAAVHCGWRGTLKRVMTKTIRTMQQNYGSDIPSLLVAFGPCISKSCYEVGEEVREKFKGECFHQEMFDRHPLKKKKYLFDLRGENQAQVLALGIPETHIYSADLCTHCEEDLFSYRRDRNRRQRLINFIGLY